MDAGQKAAQGLLPRTSTRCSRRPRNPPTVARTHGRRSGHIEILAHTTLGWVAYTRKENDAATKAFKKVLELKSVNAQVSYWLGSTMPAQGRDASEGSSTSPAPPSSRPGSARSDHQEPVAGLPEGIRAIPRRFERIGRAEAKAKESALVPAGLQNQAGPMKWRREGRGVSQTNPAMALWMSIKKELTGPNSDPTSPPAEGRAPARGAMGVKGIPMRKPRA